MKTLIITGAVATVLSCVFNAANADDRKTLDGDGILIDTNGNGYWGTNGLNLVYVMPPANLGVDTVYYGINNKGINDGAFPFVGLNGVIVENTNIGISDIAWAALDDNGGSWMSGARLETRSRYKLTDGKKELLLGWTANYVGGFGYEPNLILGDNYSACTTGFAVGQGMSPSAPPANGLLVAGAVSFDNGNIHSDGNGNLSARSFITLSDRTMKENIQPIPQGESLQMARDLADYSWNFKAQTGGDEIAPATNTQFGPMAQDWHAVTGLDDGRHISITAMQGLLLGAVKDLADQLPTPGTVSKSTDSTRGHGAGLIKWDDKYIYISVGTNQWKRAALSSW